MKQPFNEDLKRLADYFESRGRDLNRTGIELMALNKFMVGYLDTDEPFPLTEDFIEAVLVEIAMRGDVFGLYPEPLWNYPVQTRPTLPDIDAEPPSQGPLFWDGVDKPMLERGKKLLREIEMDHIASITSQKSLQLDNLVKIATGCFYMAQESFHLSYQLINFACGVHPEDAKKGKGGFYYSDPLPLGWHDTGISADIFLREAHRLFGYWTRCIEELRARKKRMKASIKKKERKSATARQRAIEIYNTLDNRSEMLASHPYKLSIEIWKKLKAEKLATEELVADKAKAKKRPQKKKKPHPDTILRWLRKEYPE